jgi:hypothetical protein
VEKSSWARRRRRGAAGQGGRRRRQRWRRPRAPRSAGCCRPRHAGGGGGGGGNGEGAAAPAGWEGPHCRCSRRGWSWSAATCGGRVLCWPCYCSTAPQLCCPGPGQSWRASAQVVSVQPRSATMSGSLGAELHNLFAGRGVGGCVMVRSRQVPGRMHGGTQRRREGVVGVGVGVGVSWVRVEGAACKTAGDRGLLAARLGWKVERHDRPKAARWGNDMTTAQKSGLPAGVNELERTRRAWWGGALAAKQQHRDSKTNSGGSGGSGQWAATTHSRQTVQHRPRGAGEQGEMYSSRPHHLQPCHGTPSLVWLPSWCMQD